MGNVTSSPWRAGPPKSVSLFFVVNEQVANTCCEESMYIRILFMFLITVACTRKNLRGERGDNICKKKIKQSYIINYPHAFGS